MNNNLPIDHRFTVVARFKTPDPQRLIWHALHQDYSANFVGIEHPPESESAAGEIAVKRLLAGERGHYGPLEHPQITFFTGYFPHSVMQQARTHRIGVSFDVQSFRYTSDSIIQAAENPKLIEEAFYLRPVGTYKDRNGKRYDYTHTRRDTDLSLCVLAAQHYREAVRDGCPEEQARGSLPFDYRQHFVVSFTLRALIHFLDMRAKADAQLEIRQLCDLMIPHFMEWTPETAAWYIQSRLYKARLAP